MPPKDSKKSKRKAVKVVDTSIDTDFNETGDSVKLADLVLPKQKRLKLLVQGQDIAAATRGKNYSLSTLPRDEDNSVLWLKLREFMDRAELLTGQSLQEDVTGRVVRLRKIVPTIPGLTKLMDALKESMDDTGSLQTFDLLK